MVLAKKFSHYPEWFIADYVYGNDENYEFCDNSNGIEKYIKFSYFHKEQKRKYKKNQL